MGWKFWEKKAGSNESHTGEVKLPGPKSIPESVGRYLVVKLKKNPDWTWNLEAVVRKRPEGKSAFDVRVFDASQATAKNVRVINFNSLDANPDLILYEGWYDKKTNQVELSEGPLTPHKAA